MIPPGKRISADDVHRMWYTLILINLFSVFDPVIMQFNSLQLLRGINSYKANYSNSTVLIMVITLRPNTR
jgi:hypothetical protein